MSTSPTRSDGVLRSCCVAGRQRLGDVDGASGVCDAIGDRFAARHEAMFLRQSAVDSHYQVHFL